MVRKTIELTDTKAIRIEPIKVGGKRYVSLRQLYRTAKNPEWAHGRQGISIDASDAHRIAKVIERYAALDESEFTEIDLEKDDTDKEAPKRAPRKCGDK